MGILLAWNEDYRPDNRPVERTVCGKNIRELSQGLSAFIRSTDPDESCNEDETRLKLIVGTSPKGAVALIPFASPDPSSQPWIVSWPDLWHFTCFSTTSGEILGTPIQKKNYRGEVTAPVKYQECASALTMATQVCQQQLGGSQILEQCGANEISLLSSWNPWISTQNSASLGKVCVAKANLSFRDFQFQIRSGKQNCVEDEKEMEMKRTPQGAFLFLPLKVNPTQIFPSFP